MKVSPVLTRWLVVAGIVLIAVFYGYKIMNTRPKESALPVYGERNDDSTDHTISAFKLMDQDHQPVSQFDFKGKLYVADFFFTTCQGICPMMTNQMERVYKTFEGNPSVNFLSHTVKPEEDSIVVLKNYSIEHSAKSPQWRFVTGDKKQIYELARKSYLVSVTEGDGGPDDFVHTQFFTLIDGESRIRGFYDGTDSIEVDKLITDIKILSNE